MELDQPIEGHLMSDSKADLYAVLANIVNFTYVVLFLPVTAMVWVFAIRYLFS